MAVIAFSSAGLDDIDEISSTKLPGENVPDQIMKVLRMAVQSFESRRHSAKKEQFGENLKLVSPKSQEAMTVEINNIVFSQDSF